VECQKHGIRAVGVEPNLLPCFASRTKTNWLLDPKELLGHAADIAGIVREKLRAQGIDDDDPDSPATPQRGLFRTLEPERLRLLLTNSISPLPLHKALLLIEEIDHYPSNDCRGHERLALAKALVSEISNLHFGPEVGVGPAKRDVSVIRSWLACVRTIAEDLETLREMPYKPTKVVAGDAREIGKLLKPRSVDAVITSPPYPNEKDYTRTTRLESVLLGFIQSKADLRSLKKTLVRSNTRCVYKGDDDERWVAENQEIQRIATAIERRRVELRKTSGFERLYARVTKLYFGGMARHLADLRGVLKPGAQLAYVVGDQASYLRVMIRTGELLAQIAESLGYSIVGLELFRTRRSTATREHLREEVVLLRWSGRGR